MYQKKIDQLNVLENFNQIKKTGAFIHPTECLSSCFKVEVALYLSRFTRWSCMEYFFHIWAGSPYFSMLNK